MTGKAWPGERLRVLRVLLWGCTLAVAAAIFAFSAQNGPASSALSGFLADLIIGVIDPEFPGLAAADQASILTFVRKLVRKGAHFAEFALLGLCIRFLLQTYGMEHRSSCSWLAGTLYACTDEVHQLFVSSRAGMWQDVLLDSCGVLTGVAFAYAAVTLWKRRRGEGT